MGEDMLKVQDAADELRMSYRGVLLLIHQNRIKAVKIGKRWLISVDEIARIKREGV
jgi:excisionase family DNA binding protein